MRSRSSFRFTIRLTLGFKVVALALIPIQAIAVIPAPVMMAVAAAAASESKSAPPAKTVKTVKPADPTEGVKVNRTVPSFVAPAEQATFSNPPTDKEIIDYGGFTEALIPIGGRTTAADNNATATFLQAWRSRVDPEEFALIDGFTSAHPESPWTPALLINKGFECRRLGYFSQALDAWQRAWDQGKNDTSLTGRALMDRAAGELAELNARLGRFDWLEPFFHEIEGRNIQGSATEKITGARQGLWLMQNKPEDAFRCGPMALDRIRARANPALGFDPKVLNSRSTLKGMSLTEVNELANQLQMKYVMARRDSGANMAGLLPAVIHWKVGHYAALTAEANGRYRVEDPTFGDTMSVSQRAINEESSGYFLVPAPANGGSLPPGWHALTAGEGSKVWGKGNTGASDPSRTSAKDIKVKRCPNTTGMAQYNVHAMLVSLNLIDSPLGYTPPRGFPIVFTATYNQREANQPANFTYSNLGQKWTHDWFSYVADASISADIPPVVYLAGGGIEAYPELVTDNEGGVLVARVTYWYDTSTNPATAYVETAEYKPQKENGAVLIKTGRDRYEKTYPDGSKDIFDHRATASNVIYPRKIFLTKRVDAAGNETNFFYDGSHRLIAVMDAIGQVTTLHYDYPGDSLKITSVEDPFGRLAVLAYNEQGQLVSITDTVGITSEFAYGTGDFIHTLTTPYGDTTFTYGDAANGGATETTRWLEVVDPAGAHERTEYRNFAPGLIVSEPAAPENMSLFNTNLQVRNTFYWDKKAMREAGGIYPKAKIYHWMHSTDINVTAGILESEKAPLESRVWYNYPDQPNVYTVGTLGVPSKVGRVLDDGTTQLYQYEYNSFGKLTKATDPANRVTTYVFDPNGIDLTQVRQTTGVLNDLLASYTYNGQHRPLTATDASGQTTTYVYYPSGQIHTVRNAQQEISTFGYNSSGYLTSITGPMVGATIQFTYDGFGRRRTTTDSEGYAVTIDYDAIGGDPTKTLDRITKVTYPDGTFEQVTYDRLDPEWIRDRLGRWSRKFYDSLRHVVATQDPLNGISTYDWCGCGSLDAITDVNGNTTSWIRDIQGRVINKVFPDQTRTLYTYENATSRLASHVDAKGQASNYEYFTDNNLKRSSYTNAQITTPSVSYTYDTSYNQLATMTDGIGETKYAYNLITDPPTLGARRVASIDGPLDNDTLTFGYDELGRVTSRSINGAANAASVQYDSIGRMQSITNPLGMFGYAYVNTTGRMDHVNYPNGQKVQYAYFDNLGDQRLKQIKNLNSSSNPISQFDYTYNPAGQIVSWTQANSGVANPRRYDFGYDAADQLRSANLIDTVAQTSLQQYDYDYDAGGNRTSEQVGNAIISSVPNNLNQLTSQSAGGKMHFRGSVNEPSVVTVGGNLATVDASGSFDGVANVNVGTNTVPVIATDASGNSRTNNYQVILPSGTARTLIYDPNGNLTSDTEKTYEWDAANRLTAINIGSHRTEIQYDGIGRRVHLTEKDSGATTSEKRFLWGGNELREERDAAGITVTKRFFGQGEQRIGGSDAGVYLYTRDHLGSVREIVDTSGAVRARYNYETWGGRTKVMGTLDCDFGFTGHYYHERSGLHLSRHRAYDSNSGEWISRDPIEESGGLNLYQYVGNNPPNGIDPLGLYVEMWYNIQTKQFDAYDHDTGTYFQSRAKSGNNNLADLGNADIGPIPPGYYVVGGPDDQDPGGLGNWVWFHIYQPTSSGDWTYGEAGPYKRGHFNLHTGSVSHGCVTFESSVPRKDPTYPQNDDFDVLETLLTNTSLFPTSNGKLYRGTLIVY